MRHFLILASLAFVTPATADEADFDFKSLGAKKALRDYKATLAKEDKAKQKAIEEMEAEAKKAQKKYRVELIMNLEQALKQAMQAGNLEEANKISGAIKALKKGASPTGASVAGSKGKKKAKKSKARIPRDAVKYKGNYYKAYAEGVPHSVAKKRCEMMGGHLARIENAAENQFLMRLSVKFPNCGGMWIDGSDVAREGVWRFSNNAPMKYTNWWPGEPNNEFRLAHNCELITRVNDQKRSYWYDVPGGFRDRGGFICEWDE
jgi:hypothetical protein